ncbi:hypothetical protein HYV10_01395 [Candidatus Dependentiae bacterium]|nr:hypothetical protein [Candidatus Dependentiae bacterium]
MKNYLLLLGSFFIVFISKFIPLSFIVGSQAAFFSGSTILALLMARHSSLGMLVLFLIPFRELSVAKLIVFLLHRAPLLFAGWSYRFVSIVASVFIPIICLLLFVSHPIGQQAWPYTLYWFIPVIVYLCRFENIFLAALSSVFVAHAVGSVIWLYLYQIESEIWLSLIPIVVLERSLMALAVVAGEYSITCLYSVRYKMKLFFSGKVA